MRNPEIIPAHDKHRDQAVESLSFEKDYALISKVKTLQGATWSLSRKLWHIPQSKFKGSGIFETLKG